MAQNEKSNFFSRIFNGRKTPIDLPKEDDPTKPESPIIPPSAGGSSVVPDSEDYESMLNKTRKLAKPGFDVNLIPIIRTLSKFNPDLGQAVFDFSSLSNTGIEITFDSGVKPKLAEEMRSYIINSMENLHEGVAGMNGLITKMFYQVWIGGAVSNEWVPNRSRTGIARITFLKPERVVWALKGGRYRPYQRVDNTKTGQYVTDNLRALNPYTYRYYGLGGDLDTPYGVPPMLTALSAIQNQSNMLDNISFVVNLMGLLGYLDARVEKPKRMDNESDADYIRRLTKLLTDTKARVQEGMRDGVNVGFKEDHEFEFHSTTKGAENVEKLWELNEQQVSSGLKFDSAFLGRAYGSNEGSITVLFTKMISILNLAQQVVAHNLEYGFRLMLLMKGYNKFKHIKVVFKKSTLTDNLKYQQGQEYKIRNQRQLWIDGIISQEEYAVSMGYEKPFGEPLVDPSMQPSKGDDGAPIKEDDSRRKAKKQREDQEKKKRDKDKPQGKPNNK